MLEKTRFGVIVSDRVAEVGSEVSNVKVGDHVVVNNYEPCMECEECRQGRNSVHCRLRRDQSEPNADPCGYYGGYGCATYQVGEAKHAYKADKNLPFEHAGFAEPVATVAYGMRKLRVKPGEKLDTARGLGFSILNAGDPGYLKKAKDATGGAGFDAAIIAVGATKAYHDAFEAVALEGRLLIFAAGYPPPEWNVDPNPVHYKLWEVIGTYGCGPPEFQTAVDLLGKNAIDVAPLVEERVPIKELHKAYEKASMPDNSRIAVMIE